MIDQITDWLVYVVTTALWGVAIITGIIAACMVGNKVYKFWSDSFLLCEIGRYITIAVVCIVGVLLCLAFIIYVFFAFGWAGLGVYHAICG